MSTGPTWYGQVKAKKIKSDDDTSELFKINCADCGAELTLRVTQSSGKRKQSKSTEIDDVHQLIKNRNKIEVEIVKATHMC